MTAEQIIADAIRRKPVCSRCGKPDEYPKDRDTPWLHRIKGMRGVRAVCQTTIQYEVMKFNDLARPHGFKPSPWWSGFGDREAAAYIADNTPELAKRMSEGALEVQCEISEDTSPVDEPQDAARLDRERRYQGCIR